MKLMVCPNMMLVMMIYLVVIVWDTNLQHLSPQPSHSNQTDPAYSNAIINELTQLSKVLTSEFRLVIPGLSDNIKDFTEDSELKRYCGAPIPVQLCIGFIRTETEYSHPHSPLQNI